MKDSKGTQNREYPAAFSEYINKFQELKAVFDNLPEGVVGILDVDLNIATANKAFSKMLKLPLNNIVGQNANKLFRKTVPGLIELLKETIQTRKGIRNYTMEIVSSSGTADSYLVSTAIIEEMKTPERGVAHKTDSLTNKFTIFYFCNLQELTQHPFTALKRCYTHQPLCRLIFMSARPSE